MARTGRPKAELRLSDEERAALEGWVRRRSTPQAWALRCRIILACAESAGHARAGAHLQQVGLELGNHCQHADTKHSLDRYPDAVTGDIAFSRAVSGTGDPPLLPLSDRVVELLAELGSPLQLAAHLRAVHDVACQLVD
ncbi:hypothetical protein ACIQZB_43710 [Streptomyces sp. NPDC097727]|uniref:hypothetical protein n=1 Tax=Streptomyces sp. NPDC097727 TaxID=3366092 RepID=UPI0037F36D64